MNLKKKLNINKSLEFQKKAKKIIPGMTQLLSKRPDMFSYGVWPGYYKKAKGAYIWDLDNNKYLDMSISAIGANILGYADDYVDNQVIKSIKKSVVSSLNCTDEIDLAKKLILLHPWASKVRFSKSGGEAVAMSIRVARSFTKRDVVAFCGYHGWHDWYLAANLKQDNLKGHLLEGLSPNGVPKGLKGTSYPFRYNNIDDLKKIIIKNKNNVAAIIMEPMRNFIPKNNFLKKIKSIAKKNKIVLIFDEITSGFRLCPGGAHKVLKVNPDMAVFGKALGNGYPISCIIGKKSVMSHFENSFISSTAWTERTGAVAANATIKKYISKKVHLKINKFGGIIKKKLKSISAKYNLPINLFGYNSIVVFVFKHKEQNILKALFIQYMLEQKILASNIVFLNNAHTKEDLKKYFTAIDKVFKKISRFKDTKQMKSHLIGEPSRSNFSRLN